MSRLAPPLFRILLLLGVLSIGTAACRGHSERSTSPDQTEKSAEPADPAKPASAQKADDDSENADQPMDGETDDASRGDESEADPDGRAASSSEQADRVAPVFVIGGHPHQGEEQTLQLTCEKGGMYPLHAEPDEGSKIVDHVEIGQGESVPRDDHRMRFELPKKKSPGSMTISPKAHSAGPEPDGKVEIPEGATIAADRHHIAEVFYECMVWYDGSRYVGPTDLFDASDFSIWHPSGGDDEKTEQLERSWWIKVEGPDETGWLRADREEFDARSVSIHDRPDPATR